MKNSNRDLPALLAFLMTVSMTIWPGSRATADQTDPAPIDVNPLMETSGLGDARAMAFSSDGKLLAIAGMSKPATNPLAGSPALKLIVMDNATKKLVFEYSLRAVFPAASPQRLLIRFGRADQLVAVSTDSEDLTDVGDVIVFDLAAGAEVRQFQGKCGTFSPGGNRFAYAHIDHISLYDVRTWEKICQVPGGHGVESFEFSPDGNSIVEVAATGAYQSTAIVRIAPTITSPELAEKVVAVWPEYLSDVVENTSNNLAIAAAMENPDWKKYRPGPPETYLAYWNKALVVKAVPNSFNVAITYTDDHPDGKIVAPIAVRSIALACGKFVRQAMLYERAKVEGQKDSSDKAIVECRIRISQLRQNDGEDLQKVFDAKFVTHIETEKECHLLGVDLQQKKAQLKQALEQEKTTPNTIEDFARVDPSMKEMLKIQTKMESKAGELELRLGKNHPAVVAEREQIEIRIRLIQAYRDELASKFFIFARADGTASLVKKDLSVEEAAYQRGRELWETQKAALDDLGTRVHQVAVLSAEMLRLEEDRRRRLLFRPQMEQAATKIELANRIEVIDDGSSHVEITVGGPRTVQVWRLPPAK